jgi:hypothetical protein
MAWPFSMKTAMPRKLPESTPLSKMVCAGAVDFKMPEARSVPLALM